MDGVEIGEEKTRFDGIDGLPEIKLKRCPFCDGEADWETKGNQLTVECIECPCRMVQKHYRLSMEEMKAIVFKRWNTRTLVGKRSGDV